MCKKHTAPLVKQQIKVLGRNGTLCAVKTVKALHKLSQLDSEWRDETAMNAKVRCCRYNK